MKEILAKTLRVPELLDSTVRRYCLIFCLELKLKRLNRLPPFRWYMFESSMHSCLSSMIKKTALKNSRRVRRKCRFLAPTVKKDKEIFYSGHVYNCWVPFVNC